MKKIPNFFYFFVFIINLFVFFFIFLFFLLTYFLFPLFFCFFLGQDLKKFYQPMTRLRVEAAKVSTDSVLLYIYSSVCLICAHVHESMCTFTTLCLYIYKLFNVERNVLYPCFYLILVVS